MKKIMPQEIELWYLIPSLRRELAKILVNKKKLNQKRISELLGVTGAAISQYLNLKRASEITFTKAQLKRIEKAADNLVKNENCIKELHFLCSYFKKDKIVCKIHKQKDTSVKKNCKICFEFD